MVRRQVIGKYQAVDAAMFASYGRHFKTILRGLLSLRYGPGFPPRCPAIRRGQRARAEAQGARRPLVGWALRVIIPVRDILDALRTSSLGQGCKRQPGWSPQKTTSVEIAKAAFENNRDLGVGIRIEIEQDSGAGGEG